MTIEGEEGFRTGLQRWSYLEDLRGGVLPDGTQRIGRGEVGAQMPLRLPTLPSHPGSSVVWVRRRELHGLERSAE